ncbi:hypothetical protein QEH42_gp169 [Microbacterium phage Pumpernickel]|uniref:Uncharacterized protein n=1 Tax=Microbacterium phage Pumpernickel TaxID=2885983 RepID=A0AAE8YBS7_9CAUD|nr:hypothetical protein QEH42_gp169 [Microbacterium phage Pumpernickel]UDL16049.1 hypothetical protein SEA_PUMPERNICKEL_299 [Microbacterium phage Pumpernickel]
MTDESEVEALKAQLAEAIHDKSVLSEALTLQEKTNKAQDVWIGMARKQLERYENIVRNMDDYLDDLGPTEILATEKKNLQSILAGKKPLL